MREVPQKHGGVLKQPEKGERFSMNSGRPKGSRNRSTIVGKWLEAVESFQNPITKEFEKLSQEDIITLAQIKAARKGETKAYNALMDSRFGKAMQPIDHTTGGDKITDPSDAVEQVTKEYEEKLKKVIQKKQ